MKDLLNSHQKAIFRYTIPLNDLAKNSILMVNILIRGTGIWFRVTEISKFVQNFYPFTSLITQHAKKDFLLIDVWIDVYEAL